MPSRALRTVRSAGKVLAILGPQSGGSSFAPAPPVMPGWVSLLRDLALGGVAGAVSGGRGEPGGVAEALRGGGAHPGVGVQDQAPGSVLAVLRDLVVLEAA